MKIWHWLIFGSVISTWALYGFLPSTLFGISNAGVFGDQFGMVNALFSGMAFAGLIVAITMQRDELKLQREELEMTRCELKGQKEQLSAQNETMQQQKFENTFFHLLEVIDRAGEKALVTGTETVNGTRKKYYHRGKAAFKDLYMILYRAAGNNKGIQTEETAKKAWDDSRVMLIEENGHYFDAVVSTMLLIEDSNISSKKLYNNFLMSSISSYEKGLIFYYLLYEQKKNFNQIHKQDLFKGLPENYLLFPEHLNLIKPKGADSVD